MRRAFALALFLLLTRFPLPGQQNGSSSGITAPVLLPDTSTIQTPKNCVPLNGMVQFSATIDASGVPHITQTLESSDQRLTSFASEQLLAQRFKPGSVNGAPAAIPVALTIGLHTCAQREKHPAGDSFYSFTLRTHPLIALSVASPAAAQQAAPSAPATLATAAQVGGGVSVPVPTHIVDPQVPVSGKMPRHGRCFVAMTVDENGLPQNIHIAKGLSPELDDYTLEAAKQWRFKPAQRNGKTPVAVEGTLVASFEFFEKEPVAFAFFVPEEAQETLKAYAHPLPQWIPDATNANEVAVRYRPESRISGRVLISLVIGTDGVPSNVHVVKGLDSSLDLDTVAMVEHLRFEPQVADDNTPVTINMLMPVRYHQRVILPTGHDLVAAGLADVLFGLM